LRCPSHPVAQAVLKALMHQAVWGLAAPSANQFGRVSPTTAAHVQGEFGDNLLILDGGACSVGIESTIIDCSRGAPVLLRPGAITPQQVQVVCGLPVLSKDELETMASPAPKASGTLDSHYAPHATVRLMTLKELQKALTLLGSDAGQPEGRPSIALYCRTPLTTVSRHVLVRRMPADATRAAQQLFAVLRECDAQGVQLIWIETPPETPEWDGVRDRLQRAAG
jgi:L-threonylcarbamoyladenylate synthase